MIILALLHVRSKKKRSTNSAYKCNPDFINEKLGPASPQNDGKQTPMKNHPVFIAMHACACCCRSCLYKWHHISKNKELTNEEKEYILNLLMLWIERELINNTN